MPQGLVPLVRGVATPRSVTRRLAGARQVERFGRGRRAPPVLRSAVKLQAREREGDGEHQGDERKRDPEGPQTVCTVCCHLEPPGGKVLVPGALKPPPRARSARDAHSSNDNLPPTTANEQHRPL